MKHINFEHPDIEKAYRGMDYNDYRFEEALRKLEKENELKTNNK